MKVTRYYAKRELTIDGKVVKPGEVLCELHSELDPERVVSAVYRGAADATEPVKAGPALSLASEIEPDDR